VYLNLSMVGATRPKTRSPLPRGAQAWHRRVNPLAHVWPSVKQ